MSGWKPASYEVLDGWHQDDHLAALACFRMSAKAFENKIPSSRIAKAPSPGLIQVAEKSLKMDIGKVSGKEARLFFEENFTPLVLKGEPGFVTAYFEPEVPASRIKTAEFQYPLLRRPKDLVKLDANNRPDGFPATLAYARQTEAGLVEYYDRGAIDNGALANKGLELFWLRSVVEGFYIHVQGSARLNLTDGTTARVSYAGKTGHPYTSIGKVLVDRGMMPLEDANMVNIRAWLEEDKARALELLHQNRSFIFFSEIKGHEPGFGPVAAAGVQLTPGRSLAVDKDQHAYGTPVWISTEEPLPSAANPFRRLMIAQDTGSAIVGPKRGDLFIGSGEEAGIIAGSVRHATKFIVFEPKAD
ncbi:MAG: MltA domain-containing protein [Pseudomonadota bacterium]